MAARRGGMFAGATAAAAAAAVLLYGGGSLNNDTMWALAWGRQITDGVMPDFTVGPTPHPLMNALGIVVAPLGSVAEPVVLGAGWLAGGLLVVLTGAVARTLYGWPAAIAAGALLLTLVPTQLSVAPAFLDVPYSVLVLLALQLELTRPRRGLVTLGVLAIAGLLRPEAWLLSGLYWLWLTPTFHGPRAWIVHSAVVASAPLVWAGADLVTTGDPMFSFTHTADATALTGRETGPSALVHLPRFLLKNAGEVICVAALVGAVASLRSERGRLAFAGIVAVTAAAVAPVVAGTPLNERYLLPTFALLCVFAAGAALGWTARPPLLPRYIGVAACALVVLQAVINLGDVRDLRRIMTADNERREDARSVLTAGPVPCRPLVVPARGMRQLAAVWTEAPLNEVRDGHDYEGRGTYLTGTRGAMAGVVLLHRRPGSAAPLPPGTELLRASDGWQVRQRCR